MAARQRRIRRPPGELRSERAENRLRKPEIAGEIVDEIGGRGGPQARPARQNGWVPPAARPPGLAFWIHQLVEYLLGVLLISQSIQSSQPLVPVLLGLTVVLLAATADGPLAAFHVVPRGLHRVLDLAVAAAIAAVAYLGRDALGPTGLIFAAVAVVALLALVVRTNYASRRPRPPAAGPATAGEPSPAAAAVPAPPAPPATKSERYSRAAGRALGKGIRAYKDPPPPPPAAP